MTFEPQNPYASYLVDASAGSGKTYQLSKRFLYLVGARAHPSSILTVTFTNKAVEEMRARIVKEASHLLTHEESQKEFDIQIQNFYEASPFKSLLQPPQSAVETAKIILASTQLLKISTIDSLFYDWVSKFPWEAGTDDSGHNILPTPFSLIDSHRVDELSLQSWEALFKKSWTDELSKSSLLFRSKLLEKGVLSIEHHLKELFKHHTFLWKLFADGKRPLAPIPLPLGCEWKTFGDLLASLLVSLKNITDETSKKDELFFTLKAAQSLEDLTSTSLITKDFRISGSLIRGKKREKLQKDIEDVESALKKFYNKFQIEKLNQLGDSLYTFYERWLQERESLKKKDGVIEFNDLTKSVYRLFHNRVGSGAVWLLQQSIKHVMIDEFQDTSLLQWSIFENLISELLSGIQETEKDKVIPTVFIVGDPKQSIYAFREADPIVMDYAKNTLETFEQKTIHLTSSYRSSQVILDFVNKVFSKLQLPGFIKHNTALLSADKPCVPQSAMILMRESFVGDNDNGLLPVEEEASYVANSIADALKSPEKYPIFDKKTRTYKPLQARDICILYRNSTHVDKYEKYLRDLNVNFRKEEKKGLFSRREIKDLLAFLSFLLNAKDLASLLTFLRCPLVGLEDQKMLDLLNQTSHIECSYKRAQSFLQAVPLSEEIKILIADLQKKTFTCLPHELLTEIIGGFHAREVYIHYYGITEGSFIQKNLTKFIELSLNLEKNGSITISECKEQWDLLQAKDEIPDAESEVNAVTLMTIHKAKGLEFPFVFIVGLGEPWYKLDRYWGKTPDRNSVVFVGRTVDRPLEHPPMDHIMQEQKLSLYEETERLLYVAMTRPSQYLFLTGAKSIRQENSFFSLLWETMGESCDDVFSEGKERCIRRQESPIKWSTHQEESKVHDLIPKPVRALEHIPAEVNIVHGSGGRGNNPLDSIAEKKETASLEKKNHQRLSAKIGVFIHRGLELGARKVPWNPKEEWDHIVQTRSMMRFLELPPHEWEELYHEVCDEVRANLESSTWQNLLSEAHDILIEQPIICFDQGSLLRGVLDLVLEDCNGNLSLVDYKSSMPPKDALEFHKYCQTEGYAKQMSLYKKALQALRPHAKIRSFLWFTKLRTSIEI